MRRESSHSAVTSERGTDARRARAPSSVMLWFRARPRTPSFDDGSAFAKATAPASPMRFLPSSTRTSTPRESAPASASAPRSATPLQCKKSLETFVRGSALARSISPSSEIALDPSHSSLSCESAREFVSWIITRSVMPFLSTLSSATCLFDSSAVMIRMMPMSRSPFSARSISTTCLWRSSHSSRAL
eukprot:Amastigsp_a11461_14.p2 type:complete len:188 gc:universal Amastigsp_a11461_14:278-841(+)